MLDQFTRGHSVDGPVIMLAGSGGSRGSGRRRGLGSWSAGSHEQDGEENCATHLVLVAALSWAGKLAAATTRG
jgi:hypothetical protein